MTEGTDQGVGNPPAKTEAEILKEQGLFQPNLVETFAQLKAQRDGLISKFKEQDRTIGELKSKMDYAGNPPASEGEGEKPAVNPDRIGEANTLFDTSLASVRMTIPDFGNHEAEVMEMIRAEPYATMTRTQGLPYALTQAYYTAKGRATAISEIRQSKEKELEARRNEQKRLDGGGTDQGTDKMTDPLHKINLKIEKVDKQFIACGRDHNEFAKKFGEGKFLSEVVYVLLDEKAKILNEQEAERERQMNTY